MRGLGFIIIAVCLAFCGKPANAAVYNHRADVDSLRQDLESGDRVDLAVRTDKVIGALVRIAERQLNRSGYRDDAKRIEREWRTRYQGMIVNSIVLEDLGDHAALSGWLQVLYFLLEAKLGTPLMEILHLDDLNILNMAIPVVFHMDIIDDAESIDAAEYGRHFEPFAGVLAYWGTWIGCEIATWGAGLFIICTPAGMAAEFITVEYVAPKFSPRLWAKFYPENTDSDVVTLQSCSCDDDGCTCPCDCGCPDGECDCDDCPCDDCDDELPPDEQENVTDLDEVKHYGTERIDLLYSK